MMKITTTWGFGAALLLALAACNTGNGDDPGGNAVDPVVYITLADKGSFVTPGTGGGVTVSGNRVSITGGGIYSIKGSLPGGALLVDSPEAVDLRFNGVEIAADTRNAVEITGSGAVTLTLLDNTSNTVTGSVFSRPPLTISGEGSLAVKAGYSGTETPAETYTAIHSDGLLTIKGGRLKIEDCYEGLEGAQVVVTGGVIDINSRDDGINADNDSTTNADVGDGCFIEISGGDLTIRAGGDGIDSNGYLLCSGGTIVVQSKSEALDAGSKVIINNGIVCAVGIYNKSPSPESEQPWLRWNVTGDTDRGLISVQRNSGEEIASFNIDEPFKSCVISLPQCIRGEDYSFLIDGISKATVTAR